MAKSRKQDYLPLLEQYGLDESAVWPCHGNPTLYHWACEQIADRCVIDIADPIVVFTDNAETVVLLLNGLRTMDDGQEKAEWTYAEVNPKNNKTAYPWAMAEKRGKDRLILKLAGLHGRLYAQSEMDGQGDGSILSGPEPVFRDATDFSARLKAAFVEAAELVDRGTVIDHVNGLLDKYEATQFAEVKEEHWLQVAALMRQQVDKWKKAAQSGADAR